MNIRFRPKTASGRWSLALLVAFIAFCALFLLLAASYEHGGDTFFGYLPLVIPILLAAASGVSAFFTGIVSIIRGKEQSVVVFVAVVVGLLVIIFAVGEAVVPH